MTNTAFLQRPQTFLSPTLIGKGDRDRYYQTPIRNRSEVSSQGRRGLGKRKLDPRNRLEALGAMQQVSSLAKGQTFQNELTFGMKSFQSCLK
jgi:hypothetical protein